MYFEKVFEVTINVHNPIDFCADKDRHLMAELRNAYVGHCYKGAYIVRVKEILRASECRITSSSASGEGFVDVRFLAEVAVFSKWDILVGVRVVSHQQMVVGTYDAPSLPDRAPGAKEARAVVNLLASRAVETLAVDQLVPVRVTAAQHQPMQTQASIVGTLLTCDQAAPVYRLRGSLDQTARVELSPLLEAIDAELGAREALVAGRKSDVWFFELLLYAYRSTGPVRELASQEVPAGADGVPMWTGPWGLVPVEAGAEPQNVLELVRRAVQEGAVPVSGYWCRSLALHRSSPLVAMCGVEPPADWQGAAIDGTPRAVFAGFLKEILDFLTAVRELAELYNTRELIDRHLNVWSVMRAAQRLIPGAGR